MRLECVWGDYHEQSGVSPSNCPCKTPESALGCMPVFFLESDQGYGNRIELAPSSDGEPTLPLPHLCPGILPDSSLHTTVPLSFHLDIVAGNRRHIHRAAVVAESMRPGDYHSLREEEWQWATAECKGCCPQLLTRVWRTWEMVLRSAAEVCGNDWSGVEALLVTWGLDGGSDHDSVL